MILAMASIVLVACGNDSSSSDVEAIVVTSVPASTPASPSVSPVVEPSAPNENVVLLVDSLPDITGPTVLWFWAPG